MIPLPKIYWLVIMIFKSYFYVYVDTFTIIMQLSLYKNVKKKCCIKPPILNIYFLFKYKNK